MIPNTHTVSRLYLFTSKTNSALENGNKCVEFLTDFNTYFYLHKVLIPVFGAIKLEPFRQKYEIKIFILAKEVLASLF